MGSINGLGSGSAWANAGSQRAARPPGGPDPAAFKDKLFNKVDTDGSGGVDATELQSLLDKLSAKTGSSVGGGDAAAFKALDSNGDGSLGKSELDAGLKSLLAAPADTMAFAQSRSTAAAQDGTREADRFSRAGPPPGAGGAGGQDGDGDDGNPSSGTSSSSGSAAIDPLDTNGDGSVSASERAAGQTQAVLKQLLAAADTNRDQQISGSEAKRFGALLSQMVASAASSGTSAGGSAAASDSSAQSTPEATRPDRASRRADNPGFADQVLRHYARASAAAAAVSHFSASA